MLFSTRIAWIAPAGLRGYNRTVANVGQEIAHESAMGRRIMSAEFEQLFRLSIPERLQLIEDLWDSVAGQPEAVPVPEWQKQELARRKAEYLKNPDCGRTWDE